MSGETTLMPCPFCSGEARYYAPGPIDHHIECVECYADIHRDTEAEVIAAWNTRTHGTLTANQVREAIEEAKAELLESCEYVGDMYQRRSDVLKVFGKMEQAIADELNAERHVETCRITASATDGLCADNPRQYFELSCGHSFTINGLDAPVACAVCGKVVKNAD